MSKDDKKAPEKKSSDTARRIWLAGIGAYGRALTEAKGAVDDLTGKSSEVFEDLVQKGEMLEKVVEYKGKEMLEKSGVKDFDINDRIKAMREKLSGGKGERVAELEAQVAELNAKLDALQKAQSKPKPKRKTTPKKTTTKRTTTKRTPKPKA
jgi:polyhydroxyalkanoate synthesis regulator phasin